MRVHLIRDRAVDKPTEFRLRLINPPGASPVKGTQSRGAAPFYAESAGLSFDGSDSCYSEMCFSFCFLWNIVDWKVRGGSS